VKNGRVLKEDLLSHLIYFKIKQNTKQTVQMFSTKFITMWHSSVYSTMFLNTLRYLYFLQVA